MVGFCAAGAASGVSVVIALRSGGRVRVLTREYRRDSRPELTRKGSLVSDSHDVKTDLTVEG